MDESLFKLELGCGKTKTDGYIGMDRFKLPGVDIVADLNKKFPIDDNSVDVIYACHSLEHFDDIEFTVNEIFRIGKHKCIVQILAPYHYTTLNLANFYHKNVFNEDTFRFFSRALNTNIIDKEDWYCPHAATFGLLGSDNSELSVELELVNMEFFYYKEYLGLTHEEKRRARRSLNNVCDQIYYELVINKSRIPFTQDEIREFRARAKTLEPQILQQLRNRDSSQSKAISIYDDINADLKNKIDKLQESFIEDLNNNKKRIQNIAKETTRNERNIKDFINDYEKKLNMQSQQINYLQSQLEYSKCQNNKISSIVLDLYKIQENSLKNKLKLFRKNSDMFSSLQDNHREFIDGIILNCNKFKKYSILNFSKIVPYEYYFEYDVIGYGNIINFFTISNIDAVLFVEVVMDGTIVKQEYLVLKSDGIQRIILDDNIKGNAYIRFKTIDNISFIKVLETINRKGVFFSKRDLASFILE